MEPSSKEGGHIDKQVKFEGDSEPKSQELHESQQSQSQGDFVKSEDVTRMFAQFSSEMAIVMQDAISNQIAQALKSALPKPSTPPKEETLSAQAPPDTRKFQSTPRNQRIPSKDPGWTETVAPLMEDPDEEHYSYSRLSRSEA